ncbi:MAG: hypothetical protein ACOC56_03410 [Atribacterota bacterium]
MNWYKFAKSSNKDFNKKIKNIIKKEPFFVKMLDIHSIPQEWIDDKLNFYIRDLKDKKAQSDSKSITFNSKLFDEENFFENGLHYLAHELYHWISRQKENSFYFADPEEADAFAIGIAYEILRGKSFEEIAELYYPIIEEHFNDKKNAKKLFITLYKIAKERVKEYK